MKTLKVKSLAYLLSFLMILGLMPITTYATAPTRLVVNGTDILTAANNTVQCGEGTAKYDSDSNTLTLENATITEGDTYNGAAIYAPTGDLNIHLVDKNEIESTRNFMVVYASSGSIEITGQGMLTVESNDTCIWAGGGGVTVSGATLNLTSTSSNGIYANNSNETASIVIKDKAHVTIDASNFGMACSGNLKQYRDCFCVRRFLECVLFVGRRGCYIQFDSPGKRNIGWSLSYDLCRERHIYFCEQQCDCFKSEQQCIVFAKYNYCI